jgi:hypothetical protein
MPELSLVRPAPPPRSPLQGAALVAFAIFTFGTVLYGLGVTAWSGHGVVSLAVTPDARGASGPRVVGPVHLDPSMSPVRVLAHVDWHPPPTRPMACFVTLRDANGRAVWSENRDFGAWAVGQTRRRNVGTTLELETFDVPRAGDYTLRVDFGPHGWDTVRGARIEVRSRVATVHPWFVYAGAFLAMVSLVTLLLTTPESQRARGERSHAA